MCVPSSVLPPPAAQVSLTWSSCSLGGGISIQARKFLRTEGKGLVVSYTNERLSWHQPPGVLAVSHIRSILYGTVIHSGPAESVPVTSMYFCPVTLGSQPAWQETRLHPWLLCLGTMVLPPFWEGMDFYSKQGGGTRVLRHKARSWGLW